MSDGPSDSTAADAGLRIRPAARAIVMADDGRVLLTVIDVSRSRATDAPRGSSTIGGAARDQTHTTGPAEWRQRIVTLTTTPTPSTTPRQ